MKKIIIIFVLIMAFVLTVAVVGVISVVLFNQPISDTSGLSQYEALVKQKKNVEILINGDLKTTSSINPTSIMLKKGQVVAIETEGYVYELSTFRKVRIISTAEIIKVNIPGIGTRRLRSDRPTEFTALESGELKFSTSRTYGPNTKFATGKVKKSVSEYKQKKEFIKGPVTITVFFLDSPSGKGGEPVKIEKIGAETASKLGAIEFGGVIPGLQLGENATRKAKLGASQYWKIKEIAISELRDTEKKVAKKTSFGFLKMWNDIFNTPLKEILEQHSTE